MDEFQEQPQEQEAAIGMGKLFGIFAALIVVCAFFFSLGYSFGKKAGSSTLIPEPVAAAPTTSTPKPSPSQSLASRTQAPISASRGTENTGEPESSPGPSESASKPAPELARNGAYAVQVAAVSRQEDAEALVSALRKKDYPVFIVSNQPGDKLFHVQIGPYASMKDAETMKSRLAGDGYNPIVKK